MTLTTEQIEERRKSIGGTDIGAILGENNYKTAYEVWEEKVEGKTVDLSRNKSVVIGQILENPLIEKYENLYGKLCIKRDTFYHKNYNFLSANIDGVSIQDFNDDTSIFEEKSIIEIKTASCFNKDEWGPSGSKIIPKHYYAQIAHYMLVTGFNKADVFVGFIDENVVNEILCEMNYAQKTGQDPDYSKIVHKMETRLYTFYRDDEIEELILNAAKDFYEWYIKPWLERGVKNSPPMDFSNKNFREFINKKYSVKKGEEIILPTEFMKIKENYLSALKQSKLYDDIAKQEKAKIVAAMNNSEKAILEDGSFFLRKSVKRNEYIVKECEYVKFEFKDKTKGEI